MIDERRESAAVRQRWRRVEIIEINRPELRDRVTQAFAPAGEHREQLVDLAQLLDVLLVTQRASLAIEIIAVDITLEKLPNLTRAKTTAQKEAYVVDSLDHDGRIIPISILPAPSKDEALLFVANITLKFFDCISSVRLDHAACPRKNGAVRPGADESASWAHAAPPPAI